MTTRGRLTLRPKKPNTKPSTRTHAHICAVPSPIPSSGAAASSPRLWQIHLCPSCPPYLETKLLKTSTLIQRAKHGLLSATIQDSDLDGIIELLSVQGRNVGCPRFKAAGETRFYLSRQLVGVRMSRCLERECGSRCVLPKSTGCRSALRVACDAGGCVAEGAEGDRDPRVRQHHHTHEHTYRHDHVYEAVHVQTSPWDLCAGPESVYWPFDDDEPEAPSSNSSSTSSSSSSSSGTGSEDADEKSSVWSEIAWYAPEV